MARIVAGLMMVACVAGCTETDPYHREGMWKPTGVNTLNLASMLDNPNDLVRGRGARGTPGVEAALGVQLYWADNPKPLPSTTSRSTSVYFGGGGGGGGGGSR